MRKKTCNVLVSILVIILLLVGVFVHVCKKIYFDHGEEGDSLVLQKDEITNEWRYVEEYSKEEAIKLAQEYIDMTYNEESKRLIHNFDFPNAQLERINRKLYNPNGEREINAICWCIEFNTEHDIFVGPIKIYVDRFNREVYGAAYRY